MKKRIGLLIVLFALPFTAMAQQQTMTLQSTIQAQPDLPNLTVMGKRQQAQFPVSTLDLHGKELLTRVPKVLTAPDPVERVPMAKVDVKKVEKVAK
jgi:hypothetical protein